MTSYGSDITCETINGYPPRVNPHYQAIATSDPLAAAPTATIPVTTDAAGISIGGANLTTPAATQTLVISCTGRTESTHYPEVHVQNGQDAVSVTWKFVNVGGVGTLSITRSVGSGNLTTVANIRVQMLKIE